MSVSARCTFRTSFALQRVFITPIARFSCLQPLASPRHASPSGKPLPTARKLPSDDLITAREIHIAENDGSLSAPQYTRDVLRNLDRKEYILQLVSIPDPENSAPGSPILPICRIMSKKQILEAAKASKQRNKPSANPKAVTKTIELNWAIDANDLNHRLKRTREFLGKGFKVEVTFAGKRKGRKASADEAKAVLDQVRSLVTQDAPEGGRNLGWKEFKPMDGMVGGVLTAFLEGKVVEEKARTESTTETASVSTEP